MSQSTTMRRLREERIHMDRLGIGHQHHVGLVDRLPAGDRGAVEHDAVGEHVLVDLDDVHGHVLHLALRIGEAQIDEFDVVVLDLLHDVFGCRHVMFPCLMTSFEMADGDQRPQMASIPVSPVRMRTTSSMLETKILPSPMRPVCAAFWMASIGAFDGVVAEHDLDLHLGQKVDDILGAAIKFGMALLAAEAFGFGDRDALQADLLKRLLHLVELERLDDRFDLFHPEWLPR